MELREQSQAEETTAQDLTLNEEAMEAPEQNEENVEVEITGETVPDLGKAMTKDDIIAALETISEKDGADISREEVSSLRQHFHAIRKSELAAEKQAFIEKGNEEAAFAPMPDELEDRFHQLTEIIKEKKAQYVAAIEAERKANLEKKLAIIDELGKRQKTPTM